MQKICILCGTIILSCIFGGCSYTNDQPFVYFEETLNLDNVDKQIFTEKLSKNISSLNLSTIELEHELTVGEFIEKEITSKGQLNSDLNYKVSTSIILWQTDRYFAVCDVKESIFDIYDHKNNKCENYGIWVDIKEGLFKPDMLNSTFELVFGCNLQDTDSKYSSSKIRVTVFVPPNIKTFISH